MSGRLQGRRALVVLCAVLAAGALFLLLGVPRIEHSLRPRWSRALVAIETAQSGLAATGHTTAAAGTRFELHAVIEAVARGGELVYYTDASALELAGKRVSTDSLRPFADAAAGRETVRVRWFTVEGPAVHLFLPATGTARVQFLSYLHPEFGGVPVVAGTIETNFEPTSGHAEPRTFGTQRFMVWIESFARPNQLVPGTRLESAGPERVAELGNSFPGISLRLPGAAGAPSELFGLTGVTLDHQAPRAQVEAAVEATGERWWFTKLTALKAQLAAAGADLGSLRLERITLEDGPPFGTAAGAARAGDLLQAGARTVVLYRDRGTAGRVDPADLSLDFERGAVVRPLSEVFIGDGELEWASLTTGG